ncbi:DUF167 family protein [Hyphococcus lacteus]|uniref:UPF0235 protein ABFZ84_07020 n=1 Tax=Hyphococcus lacteus TaxID=3143536 RepID=A0ABV3Z4D1_9PROT
MRLFVRASPGAKINAITGLWTSADGNPRLAIRVSAPPDKGKANAAILKLLAKALGLPKSALTVAAGETSRLKTIEIAGSDQSLVPALEKLAGDPNDHDN